MNDGESRDDALRAGDVAERVKDAVIQVLELHVDRAQLTEDISLYSPMLRLDSLTLLQLLVKFEQEFGIEIDDEDVMNADLQNVGSLIDLVYEIAAGSGRTNGTRA